MLFSTRSFSTSPRLLRSAFVFTAGFVVGAGVFGGVLDAARASLRSLPPVVQIGESRCDGGDAVSGFVCRNNWVSQTRYGVR